MPKKFDECVKQVMADGKTEEQAYAICTAQFQDSGEAIRRHFEDAATYDPTEKTAISIRDGVLEYLGSELGMEPADKVFTVYRSPATIANAAYMMVGIPLTDDHVSLDLEPPDTGSKVEDTEVIDLPVDQTDTRVGVRNRLSLSDTAVMMLEAKRQLSLGYHGDLVPHDKWDFEQVAIIPHHLAAVPVGRCGSLCSFLDRKPPSQPKQEGDTMPARLHKAFCDAEGAMSLEQVVEIASNLPEAIKSVPVDKLQELMPALQEVMKYAKGQGAMSEEEEPAEGGQDMDYDQKDEGMKEEFSDALAQALGLKKTAFADASSLQKAAEKALTDSNRKFADAEVKRYATVVNKARDFLGSEYDFTDKSANQIMRDAVATQTTESFEDSELPLAFKMLRKSDDYKQFGDSGAAQHPLDDLADKELS